MEQEETFVNFDGCDDAIELATLGAGTEAQLRIISAKLGHSDKEKGGDFLNIALEIVNEPYTKNIGHIIMMPKNGLDEKSNNNRKLEMKKFKEAFGVTGQISTNELVGKTAWAVLNEKDDPDYGKQNRVKNWVPGR